MSILSKPSHARQAKYGADDDGHLPRILLVTMDSPWSKHKNLGLQSLQK
jgi:hypothetical protein